MARAVTVFTPAVGDQPPALNEQALQEALVTPEAGDMPVVVLSIVGPRGSGKSALLNAVVSAVGGTEPAPPPIGFPGDSDRLCAAGIAMWSELLPVVLPSGQRAGLLLLDTWGALDDDGPERGAEVLMISAVLSSVLVVHISADNFSTLGNLHLLKDVGTAAQAVRRCTPLQEVLFLMRDWAGRTATGAQEDFEVLYEWADARPVNNQALVAMQEASDWHQSALLFLSADDPHSREARGGLATSPSDLASFLASQRSVKRFIAAVPARALARYFADLATAVTRSPSDGAALVEALVAVNQALAMEEAEAKYDALIHAHEPGKAGRMTELDLRAAHDKIVHQIRLTFVTTEKMIAGHDNGEVVSDRLLDRLEAKYADIARAFHNTSEKLKARSEAHNADLKIRCLQQYQKTMQHALKESPLMPLSNLIKNHETSRREALVEFDRERDRCGSSVDSQRMALSVEMEQEFRSHEGSLNERREQASAEENLNTAIRPRVEEHYRAIMKTVRSEELANIHTQVQNGTLALFDSLSKHLTSEKVKSRARNELRDWTEKHMQALLRQVDTQAQLTRVQHGYGASYTGMTQPGRNAGGTSAAGGQGGSRGERWRSQQ